MTKRTDYKSLSFRWAAVGLKCRRYLIHNSKCQTNEKTVFYYNGVLDGNSDAGTDSIRIESLPEIVVNVDGQIETAEKNDH